MKKTLKCLLFMLIVMASLPTFATTYAGTYYVSPGETLRINNYAGANNYSSNNGSNWRWETRLVGSWLGIDIVSKGLDYCDIKANEFLKNNNVELYFRYDYYSGVSQVEGFVCYLIKYKEPDKIKVTANPSGGSVDEGTKVYLTPSVSGATIYYTTDGTTPTTLSLIHI